MNRRTSNAVLTIASATIAVAGLLLLIISIFGDTNDNWTLNFALMSLLLSNLFNLIRIQGKRSDKK